MKYSQGLLVYQDKPTYGLLLKVIIGVVPAAMLVAGISLFSSGDSAGAILLFAETLFVGAIFWAVFPRSYQVYEDHLRIVLGGPFSIKVNFGNINEVVVTSKQGFTMNFVTRLTWTHVLINVKGGLDIAITPRDSESFIENANQALEEWREAGITG